MRQYLIASLFGGLVVLSSCREENTTTTRTDLVQATSDTVSKEGDTLVLSSSLFCTFKDGLSMRAAPSSNAAVVGKVPYGAEVENAVDTTGMATTSDEDLVIEGWPSYWQYVTYNGKNGYVASSYLCPYAPPAKGCKDLEAWINQIASPVGKPIIAKEKRENQQLDYMEITRHIYSNGVILTNGHGYEYSYTTLQLPMTKVISIFNAIKRIEEFEEVFKSNTILKKGEWNIPSSNNEGYRWNVQSTTDGDYQSLQQISIQWSDGAYYNLDITQGESEVLVTFSGGV